MFFTKKKPDKALPPPHPGWLGTASEQFSRPYRIEHEALPWCIGGIFVEGECSDPYPCIIQITNGADKRVITVPRTGKGTMLGKDVEKVMPTGHTILGLAWMIEEGGMPRFQVFTHTVDKQWNDWKRHRGNFSPDEDEDCLEVLGPFFRRQNR